MNKGIVILSVCFASLAHAATQVPAISADDNNPPTTVKPPVISQSAMAMPPNLISGYQASMDGKDRQGMMLANAWKNNPSLPQRGADGSIVYLYGATLPAVVCAPMYSCNLKLQAGEKVLQIDAGDKVNWQIAPTTFGTGDTQTTVITVKPHDSGLQTDLTITTDRRMYIINLKSRIKDWMPLVSFVYPDDVNAAWTAYYAKQEQEQSATILPATGQNIANLDFGFSLSGDNPIWRPTRVYTDGTKTYIQFPPAVRSADIPVLVVIGPDKKDQLVNYRMKGTTFVVDQVIQRAALISGVGSYQVKVTIARNGNIH